MVIDNFFLRKFQKAEELFVLFCTATKTPFIVCNEETFDDQIFAFLNEDFAKEAAKEFTEKQYPIVVLKIPKAQIMGFLNSLFSYGVNSIVLDENGADKISIALEQLVKKPDVDKLQNDKVPRINPELQITSIYFLQDIRRKIDRTPEENKKVKDMEEEMAINLFRSRLIIALDITGNKDMKFDPRDKDKKYKLITIKTKNDEMFLPCFTDFNEFRKFSAINKKGKFNLLAIPYKGIKDFCKETKGIVINPSGFNLMLRTETLDRLNNMYGFNPDR